MASPERRARLAAIARAHRKWEDKHLAESAPDPNRISEGGDYGLHHLTVDATPAQAADLAEMVEEELRAAGLTTPSGIVE